MINKKTVKKKTALIYVLSGLIPYTEANLLLSYKPNQFFDELEACSNYSKKSLRNAYAKAVKRGNVKVEGSSVYVSLRARQKAQPFVAAKLHGSQLMVIFDIPEEKALLRHRFRYLLKYLEFKKVQHSVWMSDKDHKKIIKDTITELGLEDCVEIYEALKISEK